MDLSALIFVALAVAWAVYLIPKALKHHEDAQQRRPVEGFSDSMRVLATREPVNAKTAALVVPSRTPAPEAEVSPAAARAAAARVSLSPTGHTRNLRHTGARPSPPASANLTSDSWT